MSKQAVDTSQDNATDWSETDVQNEQVEATEHESVEVEEHEESEVESEEGETESQESDQEAEESETEETEDEFYLGDEALESPTSDDEEDNTAPDWVKNLRKEYKESAKENKELKARLQELESGKETNSEPVTELPSKPRLEDVDYDEDAHEKALDDWYSKKSQFESQKSEAEQKQKALREEHNQKVKRYQERKQLVKVQGFDIAEKAVMDEVPQMIQAQIIHYSDAPEMVVLAAGRNADIRQKLAQAKDPIELGRLIGSIEAKARIAPKAKKPSVTTPKVKGGSGPKHQAKEDRAFYAAFPDAKIS